MQFSITATRRDLLPLFPAIAVEEIGASMTVAVEIIAAEAQMNAPVSDGFYRSSIAPEVRSSLDPLTITGIIGSSSLYARIIEGVDEAGNPVPYGRRPGAKAPPASALIPWVVRHLPPGVTAADEKAVLGSAIALSKAIAARGLSPETRMNKPGRPMVDAVQRNVDQVHSLVEEALVRVARRVEGTS